MSNTLRDPFMEYRKGRISWDKAYAMANNNAALLSSAENTPREEVEYWCKQMESLAVDAADRVMTMLGYKENEEGMYFMPSEDLKIVDDLEGPLGESGDDCPDDNG
jgi:hypothetical protein